MLGCSFQYAVILSILLPVLTPLCHVVSVKLVSPGCGRSPFARPCRLARPRTPPVHGENTSSNLVGDANTAFALVAVLKVPIATRETYPRPDIQIGTLKLLTMLLLHPDSPLSLTGTAAIAYLSMRSGKRFQTSTHRLRGRLTCKVVDGLLDGECRLPSSLVENRYALPLPHVSDFSIPPVCSYSKAWLFSKNDPNNPTGQAFCRSASH